MPLPNPINAAVDAFKRTFLKGAGGRQTQPQNFNPFNGMPYSFVPRRLLSGLDLSQYKPSDFAPWLLMQILADSHTDVGLALWNILRLGCSGFEYSVKTLSGSDDAEGKSLVDALLNRINKKSGGVEALHIQWMLSWYLYGAVCGEEALTDDLKDVLDIYAVNPFSILFRRDSITQDLVMYQQQIYRRDGSESKGTNKSASTAAGGYRELNENLVYYTPCDPTIDDPYGRMPSAAVINEVFFDINFWVDLQKIVHGVAAPKYVVKIIEEIAAKSCPPAIKNDPKKYAAWLDDIITSVEAAFTAVPADAAFVNFDSVEIDIVSAKSGGNILSLVEPLTRAIERRMIKALKMLPILMASNEATTETHGSVQFEIFAAGIHSAQSAIANMMAQMLKIFLQIMGRQCLVTCSFKEIRTANRLLAANAENKEIINALLKEAAGFQTHDDSSIEVTGSKAVAPAMPGFLESLAPTNSPTAAETPAAAREFTPEAEEKLRALFDELWKDAKQELLAGVS